ncbi:MAG: WbqC family protein [Anaerolineaceae bacterium]|nr:WbqC family protein [Anaerolineaceae bacterium]
MKCVILQPSYIPWRGYFHQIAKADIFVFYDDVQYDKRGWRNRNQIKTSQGIQWLTIPVHSKGVQLKNRPIHSIEIAHEHSWQSDHWKAIKYAYQKAPFFDQYSSILESHFQKKSEYLADFTIELTVSLAKELGINYTEFIRSSTLNIRGQKTDRLINILKELNADHYITGPSAKSYIEEEKFKQHGIFLEIMNYEYREYPQLFPPFVGNVSIIDLLFMTGKDALKYIID